MPKVKGGLKFMNIAESIKKKREEYDIEQQELAQRIGVNKSFLSAVEGGTRTPSLAVTIALADTLHCSIDELIGRKVS